MEKFNIDMTTNCASIKTAMRRFDKKCKAKGHENYFNSFDEITEDGIVEKSEGNYYLEAEKIDEGRYYFSQIYYK